MKDNKLGTNNAFKAIKNDMKRLMRRMCNDAVYQFRVVNFDRQGFVDGGVQKWKKRKSKKDNSGRRLLVKTGAGRRSIRIMRLTSMKGVVEAGANYMSYHNEGTARLPQRQFMGNSRNLEKKFQERIFEYIDSRL